MARNFPVPPVVFNMPTPTYRSRLIPRAGAAQQPPRRASMSFNDEPPLLEEIGIDTRLVWRNTLSILLHPLRSGDPCLHADADLSRPFLFILCFGLFQLLAGKFHFVLASVALASFFLRYVFSTLSSGRGDGQLDLYRCASIVGHGMLPMVIFSAVVLFLPRGGGLIFGVAMGFALWSTRVCTGLLAFTSADENRGRIAYACFLVYMIFSLLVIS